VGQRGDDKPHSSEVEHVPTAPCKGVKRVEINNEPGKPGKGCPRISGQEMPQGRGVRTLTRKSSRKGKGLISHGGRKRGKTAPLPREDY